MSVPRNALPVLCMALLGAMAFASAADAQGTQGTEGPQDQKFDLKPLIPPVFHLPPNSQVTPGGAGPAPFPGDRQQPQYDTQSPSNPGMRITIPTSPTR